MSAAPVAALCPAGSVPSVFNGLALRPAATVWVFFLPFTSLAAGPPEAAAPMDLPDVDC